MIEFGSIHSTTGVCDNMEQNLDIYPSQTPIVEQLNISEKVLNNYVKLSPKPYECEICFKNFVAKANLMVHYRVHTNEKPFPCDICSKKFSQKGNLTAHYNIHINRKSYSCDICKKTFTQKGHLDTHRKNNHMNSKLSKSGLCPKQFVDKATLMLQLRKHGNWEDQESDKKSNHEVNLDINMPPQVAALETPHKIKKSLEMKDISEREKQNSKKPYQCEFCPKSFLSKTNLMVHYRVHTNEKPFSCDKCFQKFSQKGNLIAHEKTHFNIKKPYSCDVCRKKFTQKGNRDAHRKTHLNIKPYSCDVCQKKFTQKGNRDAHRKIHSNIKPYSCDVCQKKFNQKGNRDTHRKTHANIKQNKRIQTKDLEHKAQNSKKELHECEFCHTKLLSKVNLICSHNCKGLLM